MSYHHMISPLVKSSQLGLLLKTYSYLEALQKLYSIVKRGSKSAVADTPTKSTLLLQNGKMMIIHIGNDSVKGPTKF